MYKFRVITEIESPSLGDMLGTLQTAGCVVLDCSLIADHPVADPLAGLRGKVVEHVRALPVTPAKPKPKVVKQPRAGGPTQLARSIMAAMPPGHVFLQGEVYSQLRRAGHGESSSRSGFQHALNGNKRISKRPDGRYAVLGNGPTPTPTPAPKPTPKSTPKPFVRPAPLNVKSKPTKYRTTSAFVRATIDALKPGEQITRQQFMERGKKEGQTIESMNTVIHDQYKAGGPLERLGKGIYRKVAKRNWNEVIQKEVARLAETPPTAPAADTDVHIEPVK